MQIFGQSIENRKQFISYACMGREGGVSSQYTLAYSQGGRVENFIFFVYVLNVWSLIKGQ